MFDPHCPRCDARVLLTTRRLTALTPTEWGHRAELVCWCGTPVTMDVRRVVDAPEGGVEVPVGSVAAPASDRIRALAVAPSAA